MWSSAASVSARGQPPSSLSFLCFWWNFSIFVTSEDVHAFPPKTYLEVCRGQHDETRRPLFFSPLSKTGSLSLLICTTESKRWLRPCCQVDFLDAKLVDWDFSDSDVYCATCPNAQTSTTFHTGCLSKKFFMKTKMNETQRYKDFMVFFMFISNLL